MTDRFRGRTAVITGGASGIGEATVRLFVAQGGSVVIADIDQARGDRLADELGDRARFAATDVTSESDIAGAVNLAVKEFGRLDLMFNNAGVVGAVSSILELSAEEFDRTLSTNLRGFMLGMKHAARVMVPQRSGVILSTSSIAAVRGDGPHAYTAAKAGVAGLTRSVANELWEHNIRVNAILPGRTRTPMLGRAADDGPAAPDGERDDESRRQRLMGPREVANAALFLASPEAAFITGESLTVDGGLTWAGSPSGLAGRARGPATG